MVKPMEGLSPEVRLLTMLNVDSARPTKRQRSSARDWHSIAKKAKATASASQQSTAIEAPPALQAAPDSDDEEAAQADAAKRDSYDLHWAQDSPLVEGKGAEDLKDIKWSKTKRPITGLGECTEWLPQGAEVSEVKDSSIVSVTLLQAMEDID